MKRLLTILLAVMTAGHCLAYDFRSQGINYNIISIEDKTVEITYQMEDDEKERFSGNVTIPSSVTYDSVKYSVISIGSSAFQNCNEITTVILPDSLTHIGSHAFDGCKKLSYINFSKLESIGDYAFQNCIGFSSITISNSVKTIGQNAFSGCSNLVEIYNLSSNPQEISSNTFSPNITLHVLEDNVTTFQKAENWKTLSIIGDAIDPTIMSVDYKLTDSYGKIENNEIVYYSSNYILVDKWVGGKYRSVICFDPTEEQFNTAGWSRIVNFYKGFHEEQFRCQYKYIIKYENYFNDGESYANSKSMTLPNMVYKRKFNNNQWQSLYVPFSLSIDDLKSRGITIAELNDTHQKDNNSDGIADETEVEFFTLPTGYTKPNHPYLIRAEYNTEISMSMSNVELSPSAENYIDCSTTKQTFTFCGTYSGVTGAEMYSNHYYGMSGGALQRAANSSVSLKPQRWYMKIENRDGSDVAYYAPSLRMIIDGIEEEETTGLIMLFHDVNTNDIYDLNGIKKCNHWTNLFHIKDGRKILIK